MNGKQKIFTLITNIITGIISALGGFLFGGN